MKVAIQFFLLLISALTASFALAHPGHDHSAWTANPIHALFYFSIAAGIALLAFIVTKHLTKKEDKK